LVILYFQKPGIFYFNKKNDLVYAADYEDIVNQDFDSLTEQSVNEKKYADAIRWQYLKTLKILHEAELISYDMYKTVNEYVYEIKNTDLRKLFKNLSREFVYYRYGKGEADASRFNRFKLESEEIKKILNR
jgi:23S rRNA maturation-related 3'-5' exoribonuclease YhaM